MKSKAIALFCLIFLFCGSVPILENTQSNSIPPAEVVTTKTLSGDNITGFSDHFTTDSTGYNPDLWSLESYDAEGNVTWENETLLGLTSWGHGYRTIVSNWSTGPNFVADFRTKFCDSNSLPAIGWMDVTPDQWNYNPTGGQNGVWIEFNWPIGRQVSFYTKMNGVETYTSINVDTYYDYHDYRILWTNDSAALFIDGTMRANSSSNIPDVNLPFKALVTSWSGDAQGQWMHLDYVNVSQVYWSDDFNDGDYNNWTVNRGGYTAANGFMNGTTSSFNWAHRNSTVATGTWSYDQHFVGASALCVFFMCTQIDPLEYNQPDKGYFVNIANPGGGVVLELCKDSTFNRLAYYDIADSSAQWYHVEVTRDRFGNMKVYLNGTLRIEYSDTTYTSSEYFYILGYRQHSIDNIIVYNSTAHIEGTDIVGPNVEHSRLPNSPTQSHQVLVEASITDLTEVSKAILSFTNNSGVQWHNVSMTTSGGNWTATIPEHAVGVEIQYKIYANDTLGNWEITSDASYIIADGEAPQIIQSHSPLNPIQSDQVVINANVTDYSDVSSAILSYTNNSGIDWYNSSMTLSNGNWTATIPIHPIGTEIQYKVYANDSEGNWAISTPSIYTVTDGEAPQIIQSHSPLKPIQSDVVVIDANVTDYSEVASAILSYTNNSGIDWYNISMTLSSGNWTATIPMHPVGTEIQYKVYANDSEGNGVISTPSIYTIADGEEPTIFLSHSPIEPIQSDEVVVSANVTDYSSILQVILSYIIDSGVWHNTSMVLTSENWTASITAQEVGSHVSYKIYAEDSEGNWAISTLMEYTVLDGSPQTFEVTHSPINPTSIQNVIVMANISDSGPIVSVILSHRINSGTWHNSSMSYNEGSWTGVILMQSNGTRVDYKIYAEDDAGNWGVSIINSYTVTDITTTTTTTTDTSSTTTTSDTSTTSEPPDEGDNVWTFFSENPVILAAIIAGTFGIISALIKYWSDRKKERTYKRYIDL